TTGIALFAHAVGESNDDVKALIGAAPEYLGPGFLVPSRNTELLRWCLQHGLRLVQQMTLMTIGLYNEPAGADLPSSLYSAGVEPRGLPLNRTLRSRCP